MDKKQVLEIFKVLQNIYPRFMPESTEEAQDKLNTWTRMMRDMDFKRVMKKVEEHIIANKFPPSIAEISAYAPKDNESLRKMEQWRKEAENVPQETKDRFQAKLKELMEAKTNGQ
ncbi:Loader and inhibitor of phage G40P [Halobacillus karajensis]|uniref:replicative helicase loader/inhibitor n=1 Tax=Halobacillus karajensis TaxID=195088 RepID=UPI0008A7AFC0|nr:replicative helicase loader/inhibitor [Halobacillus karajensis]SEH77883.1 Loader and inhibitor of phage G40P [Halobacillus karajensis]